MVELVVDYWRWSWRWSWRWRWRWRFMVRPLLAVLAFILLVPPWRWRCLWRFIDLIRFMLYITNRKKNQRTKVLLIHIS
jgi:hypothetical protein